MEQSTSARVVAKSTWADTIGWDTCWLMSLIMFLSGVRSVPKSIPTRNSLSITSRLTKIRQRSLSVTFVPRTSNWKFIWLRIGRFMGLTADHHPHHLLKHRQNQLQSLQLQRRILENLKPSLCQHSRNHWKRKRQQNPPSLAPSSLAPSVENLSQNPKPSICTM